MLLLLLEQALVVVAEGLLERRERVVPRPPPLSGGLPPACEPPTTTRETHEVPGGRPAMTRVFGLAVVVARRLAQQARAKFGGRGRCGCSGSECEWGVCAMGMAKSFFPV